MNERACMTSAGDVDAGMDAGGYPVETTGNAVLDTLEHRSSTRVFARDDDDRPVAVTDERDGGSEHAETPHKLKRTKAGVYPIVTKICAAIGVCAQQPAILTRTCDGVAQCSGDLRDNGRELHGNVKAS